MPKSFDRLAVLQNVNAWVGKHLKVDESGARRQSARDFQRSFLEDGVTQLCKTLKVKPILVTIRTLYRAGEIHLRPVFSNESYLHEYFSNPANQKAFPFSGDAFYDTNSNLKFGSETFSTDPSRHLIGAVYRLADRPPRIKAHSGHKFRPRIRQFFKKLGEQHPKSLPAIAKIQSGDGFCLIAGVECATTKTRSRRKRFEHFLAIYWKSDKAEPNWIEQKSFILEYVRSMFLGVELIHQFNSALFENEGLRLVSYLTAPFANQEIPSADKMSYLLEKLKQLLSRHLIGVEASGEDVQRHAPNVYYIATQFGRPIPPAQEFRPSFQLYPLCYAQSAVEQATSSEEGNPTRYFLIAHSKIPSVAKLLMMHYFDAVPIAADSDGEQRIVLSKEFKKLFMPKMIKGAIRTGVIEKPDQLHLTSESEFWEALTFPTLKGEPRRNCIVAFVIEGGGAAEPATRLLPLPLGVLVIEATAYDAFSDADVASLRAVAAGVAPLIRGMQHRNASIDYAYAIAKTFENDIQSRDEASGIPLGRFLFNLLRIDAKQYEHIMKYLNATSNKSNGANKSAEHIVARTGLNRGSLLKLWRKHEEILKPHSDPRVLATPEEENLLLRVRREAFLSRASSLKEFYEEAGASNIYEFLAACPPNYVWFGYLRSIPQALGDRAAARDPEFHRVGPGFSADALFMASIDGELRQIVKLSTWKKLDQERRKYRDFVRYKTPFAARIPAGAYAIDSRGTTGIIGARQSMGILPEEPGDDSFGALVSDLVDGKPAEYAVPDTFSFLDTCCGSNGA